MQVPLALQDAGHLVVQGDRGGHPADQVHRALVQRALGLAGRGPLDPAVRGIRGRGVHPGQRQRPRVHPGAVVVAVGQEHRPVGDHLVEVLLGGHAAGEHVHAPAAAGDPGGAGVAAGVGADRRQVALPGVLAGQVALAALQPAAGRVHVRVLEPGQQHPPAQVDHLGARAHVGPHFRVGAHRRDPAILDRDRLRPGPCGVHGVHRSPGQHQVGRALGVHRPPLTWPPRT